MATARKKTTAPDAIALLKADHKKVRALLETLDKTDSAPRRLKLISQIEIEKKAHAQVEEEIFYPAFKRKAEESEQLQTYFEALEEHGLAEEMLQKTLRTKPDGEEFGARAKVLKDLIIHHAKEEEKEMFKQARELFDRDELRTLGDRIQRRKREILRELKAR